MLNMWRKTNTFFAIAVFIVSALSLFLFPKHTSATAGINSQLSFEGKVVTAAGINIPDGTYNMEFKIYQDGTNTGVGSTLKYTEDYLVSASNGVVFTSGTFQVNLGSITPFGASVDWNQNTLWLSMQIGNTSSCTISTTFQSNCGGDGEMTPYIRLTATPYALNSNLLGGLASSAFGQLASSQTWTGTNTFQPTTNINSVTIKQTSFASPTSDIFDVVAANGTTNLIQVTGPSANNAAVNINSAGSNNITLTAGATVQTLSNTGETVQTTTNSTTAFQVQNSIGAPVLVVDTTNTNLILNPGFEVNSNNWAISGAGTGLAVSRDAVKSHAYLGVASLLVTTASGTANTGAQTTGFTSTISAGTYTLSFEAKASGSNFTTLAATMVGGGGTCTLNTNTVTTTGYHQYYCTVTTTSATTAISFTVTDTTQHSFNLDSVQLTSTSTLNPYNVGNIQLRGVINSPTIFEPSSNSTTALQIQDITGSSNLFIADTTDGTIGIGTSSTPGALLSVGGTTGNFQVVTSGNITSNGTYNTNTLTSSALTFGAASSASVASAAGQSITFDSGTTGNVNLGTSANAKTIAIGNTTGATAITIQAGTGNLALTTQGTGQLNIGANAVAQTLNIGNTTGATAVTIQSGTGNLALTTQGTGQLNIGNNAVAQTINIGNVTGATAVNLKAGTGNISLNAPQVIIGNGTTGDTTGDLIVLDSKTNAGDPTEVNGAMYYNSNSGYFRCGVAGVWVDCLGGLLSSNTTASSAVNTCTAACSAFTTTSAFPANYCVPGRTIHIYASGVYSDTAAGTLAMGLYIGSNSSTKTSDTLIGAASGTVATGAAVTNVGWSLDYYINCFTSGSSGTVNGQGTFRVSTTSTTTNIGLLYSSTNTTINTTTAQTIYLFPAWSVSAAGNTATVEQFDVNGY